MRALLLLAASPSLALACGGFFCNPIDPETGLPIEPVVQSAERVLFEVHDDDTITTTVEIQYQGDPVDFSWVLPLPHAIDPDDVSVAPAGLFDELDELTAPVFTGLAAEGAALDAAGFSMGCASPFRRGPWASDAIEVDPFAGVDVVGEAVVGPYAVEIITAENAGNLGNWLIANGYDIPPSANGPIAHYVASGGAFLGLKLQPELPAGPIDALSFTTAGTEPMLPLRLTAIAAVPDMEVLVYVLGQQRYATAGWTEVPVDYGRVQSAGLGTDYEAVLQDSLAAAGGRGFHTEFAGPTDGLGGDLSAPWLASQPYLTRLRTIAGPEQMTSDPLWQPAPELGDVAREHALGESVQTAAVPWGALLLLVLPLLARRRAGWRP